MTETGLIETVESEVISATACGQTKMETSANQIDKTTPKHSMLIELQSSHKGKNNKNGQ